MRRFAYMNFQITTKLNSKLSYTPCYVQVFETIKLKNMVAIKLKNVSVKSGDRFRNNQNYTMVFWKKDGIDETSTVDDIRELIVSKYSNRVTLNKSSQIEIVDVSKT